MTPVMVLVVSARGHPDARTFESHGYAVLPAHSGADAVSKAIVVAPDAAVIDGALPDLDPFALARALREDAGLGRRSPILVTASNPPTSAQHRAALRAGVWEILVEPYPSDDLPARLTAYLLGRDRATTPGLDPDTGLYDQPTLDRWARELARRAFHHRAPLACVVVAPDTADAAPDDPRVARVVARVAEALKTNRRRSDAVGRVGPTEFAVVAPGTDAQGAVALAERLARAVEGIAVTLRAGYDAVPNAHSAAVGPGQLLARAVQALRRSRDAGIRIGTLPD